jgi:predicted DsbA family dithiol-disulfide isomerase
MSMMCDLQTGLCSKAVTETTTVSILLITDPICSSCWVMEPAWRRLQYHYGEWLKVRYIYGGLLPRWEGFADQAAGIRAPSDVAPHWAEVARHSGQPIDPSVWLRDPLSSSYPPSIAAHAVRLIDVAKEEAFLRCCRQALFLEAKNIARTDVLAECAADVGLNRDEFLLAMEGDSARTAFEHDLLETRCLPVHGFPTLIMQSDNGQLVIRGNQSFARLEQAILQLTGLSHSIQSPTAAEALAAYRSGTTKEFSELLQLNYEKTKVALAEAGAHRWDLAGDTLWIGTH